MVIKKKVLSLFILRERECKWGRSRARKGERERISSRFLTISAESDVGLKLRNCEIMT